MRSHGAGLALWTALSLLQVRGREEVPAGGRAPPRRGPDSHSALWSPGLRFGEGGGRISSSAWGTVILF